MVAVNDERDLDARCPDPECNHKLRHHGGKATEEEPEREGCIVRRGDGTYCHCKRMDFATENEQMGLLA